MNKRCEPKAMYKIVQTIRELLYLQLYRTGFPVKRKDWRPRRT